jgi:hypothetical protein
MNMKHLTSTFGRKYLKGSETGFSLVGNDIWPIKNPVSFAPPSLAWAPEPGAVPTQLVASRCYKSPILLSTRHQSS